MKIYGGRRWEDCEVIIHIRMKLHKIFFIVLVFFLTKTAASQNKADIGIEGGPTLIFLRGNTFVDDLYSKGIGFTGGVSFQYNFGTVLSLKTNLFIERKGAVIKNIAIVDNNANVISRNATFHEHYDYLTLPILVRASLGKKVRFFLNTGPYFGFLIKQTIKLEGAGTADRKMDNTKNVNRFDTGLATGLGTYTPLGKKLAFTLEFRHNLGLYNVSKISYVDGGSLKMNSTAILVGLAYKLGNTAE
jgi:hypothetical protein